MEDVMLSKFRWQRGQALILIVFAIVGLIAITAVAIDSGNAYSDRRNAQSAADNAALAGALQISASANTEDVQNAIENIVTSNGYPNASIEYNGSTVKAGGNPDEAVRVNNPPAADCNGSTSSYSNPDEYIQVVIHSSVDTYFGSIVGIRQVKNCVQAIAHASQGGTATLFGGAGIVALTLHDLAYNLPVGSPHITVHNGNLFSNSDRQPSVVMDNDPRIYLDEGYTVGVVADSGGTSFCAWCVPPPVTNGVPQYSQEQIDTTLATVPDPSITELAPTCPVGASGIVTKTGHAGTPSDPYVISAGDYLTGLDLAGSGWYTMQSGVYCFTGSAGFQGDNVAGVYSPSSDVVWVMGNNNARMEGSTDFWLHSLKIYTQDGYWYEGGGSNLYTDKLRFISTGTGNMQIASDTVICNLAAGGTNPPSSQACNIASPAHSVPDTLFYFAEGKPIWDASAKLNLHAPPSGLFKGLLVYLPWDNTSTITFAGGTYYSLTGTYLAPHCTMNIGGGNEASVINSQIIAYKFYLDGGAKLTLNYGSEDNYGQSVPTIELTK
jgi:Flp pilus assembly protein TadG